MANPRKHYYTLDGGYISAVECLREKGGCLFPAKRNDGSSTVVCGNKIYTFWENGSLNKAKVQEAAKRFGFDPEHATGGRLAKWILSDICGLDCAKESTDMRFLALAREGFHWHYTFVEEGHHPYLLEFDLQAAYMTSLLSASSLKYTLHQGYLDDSGALDCLREISPDLPKWLRLIIIGCLASHRMQYLTMGVGLNGYPELKSNFVNKVDYGTAFNAAHKAIFRVYRCMEQLHRIGGDHIKRIHTDSFALTGDCPCDIESQLFEYLDSLGFTSTCKAQGTGLFFNLNEGLIGRKWVGSRAGVRERLAELERKPKRYKLSKPARDRWGDRGVVFDTQDFIDSLPTAYVQHEIIDTNLYTRIDESFRSQA